MNMLSMAVVAASALLVPAIDFISQEDTLPATSQPIVRSIDVIMGDGDFNQVRPEYPSDHATELRNHTQRLQYIESMLRGRDVSGMPAELRAERMRNLDRLHDYWMRAEYPVNYEHPTAWEPCFIDAKGAICAVGYLIEQSAGRELAEKINSRYQYATVKEIDAPELAEWIAGSGLSKAEVVTIQGPSIGEDGRSSGWPIVANNERIRRILPANRTVAESLAMEKNAKADKPAILGGSAVDNVQAIAEPQVAIEEPVAVEPPPVATQPSNAGLPGIE